MYTILAESGLPLVVESGVPLAVAESGLPLVVESGDPLVVATSGFPLLSSFQFAFLRSSVSDVHMSVLWRIRTDSGIPLRPHSVTIAGHRVDILAQASQR